MGQMTLRNYYGGDRDHLHVVDIQGYEEPWSELEIHKHGHEILVVEIDARPNGYCCVESVGNSARLLRFTIATAFRRQGYGSRLMSYLLAEYGNMKKMTTVVPESNLSAQLFLRQHGWKYVNTLRGHFTNCGRLENGYYFLRML